MIISERIFCIMKERGMNQQEFAKKTGISQSVISDWKRKKTNPSADKIAVICKALDITPNELLLDMEDHYRNNGERYLVVSEGTDRYNLLIEYEDLDRSSRDRLIGYMQALKKSVDMDDA